MEMREEVELSYHQVKVAGDEGKVSREGVELFVVFARPSSAALACCCCFRLLILNTFVLDTVHLERKI